MLQLSRVRSAAVAAGLALAFVAASLPLAAAPAAQHAAEVEASKPVDINAADEGQLMAIPGIGQALAQRILEWRQEHGPFQRVEDLMKVKGIGDKSFEKLRPYVTVTKAR